MPGWGSPPVVSGATYVAFLVSFRSSCTLQIPGLLHVLEEHLGTRKQIQVNLDIQVFMRIIFKMDNNSNHINQYCNHNHNHNYNTARF